MAADLLLIGSCAAAVGGSAALRHGWSLPCRSAGWNASGWGLYAVAAMLGWAAAGAWGVSIACLAAMGTALLILGHAALTSPTSPGARASNRRVGALPERGEPWRVGGRIVTFLIVTIAAPVVSLGLAVAVRALFIAAQAGEADANVASFYAMPLAWAVLAVLLLMEQQRLRQWLLLGITAIPGALGLIAGLVA